MGGGGGNDDYGAQQAAIETKKQTARDALNAIFGVGTGAAAAPAPAPNVENDSGDSYFPRVARDLLPAPAATSASSNEIAKNKAGRDALYQKVRDDAFTAGKRRFDETKDQAARDTRFALFAQGLNGGSADVDENALLNRTYSQGLLDLGSKADAARMDMQGNDENTRLGLLQSIDNGMDQGSALSSALSQLKVNSDRAASSAQGTAVGDLFANAGLLYTKSQAARGKQAANDWWATGGYPFNGPHAPGGASGPLISNSFTGRG